MNYRIAIGALVLAMGAAFVSSCADEPGGSDEIICPPGLTACGRDCVNVLTHPMHCGVCGGACTEGRVCDGSGTCAVTCQSELSMCDETCVNLTSSKAHCGACDMPCPASHRCFDSKCEVTCEETRVACDGECIDPLTDPRYCGVDAACAGSACPKGNVCDGTGNCAVQCATGYLDCNGACIDPTTDDRFCGASGSCSNGDEGVDCADGYRCTDGACVISCPVDFAQCGDTCVDPMTHPDFCGASGDCEGPNAGIDCPANEACVQGTCAELGCLPVRPGFLGGVVGPVFSDGCWTQCAGYLDEDDGLIGDQVPADWGGWCELGEDNLLRIVCGDDTLTSYRYIDVSKNVFRDLLMGTQESGLIIDARDQDGTAFTVHANDIFGDTSDPDVNGSRWGGGVGCDGTSASLIVNTAPGTCREVANCFGLEPQIAGGDMFLGVYVKE